MGPPRDASTAPRHADFRTKRPASCILARLVASERTKLAGGKDHSRQVTPGTNNNLHIASVHDGIFGYSNKLDKMKFPDGARGRCESKSLIGPVITCWPRLQGAVRGN